MDRDAVGDCVVIHRGQLVAEIGGSRRDSVLWSSCVRTWRTLIVLQAIQEGRIRREALWEPAGAPFPPGVLLIHVLSRTSNGKPPGSSWRYSGGDHWPWQHAVVERLTGESREQQAHRLISAIGARLTMDRDKEDGTQRIHGSPYEMAKLGYLMLRNGEWNSRQVFPADLWAMATGGGVVGDGRPNPLEGWQTHLIKGGMHSDGFASSYRPVAQQPMATVSDRAYFAAGGTNRSYVFVDPVRDVVVARVRHEGVYIDQFLPGLLEALDLA